MARRTLEQRVADLEAGVADLEAVAKPLPLVARVAALEKELAPRLERVEVVVEGWTSDGTTYEEKRMLRDRVFVEQPVEFSAFGQQIVRTFKVTVRRLGE